MNKKILIFLLLLIFTFNTNNFITLATEQTKEQQSALDISAKSAILIEATTGKVLYELNPDERLSPASVTKVMTLYLIYEAIEQGKIKWDDIVTTSEYASSMGGSQIFLEPMEKQDVKTLTKSIAIASANDAAVAMAEYISGSEEEFVKLMNKKAKELGMENTNFENACGLDTDTTNHYMSARDIAIISKELMTKYPDIKEFTTKWQDTITHKTQKGETEFGLTNTNKLLKMYDGATGLKTGSTKKALYCLSGSAERDGLSLIAVVMAAPDPKVRFQEVAKMFDYGFANYQVIKCDDEGKSIGYTNVYKGEKPTVNGVLEKPASFVIKKGASTDIKKDIQMIEGIKAPITKGTKIGEAIYTYENNEIGRIDILAEEDIKKASLNDIFKKLMIDWVI
ncbi:D-alanyl-D-alanine carboxypeptidase family protein [[Clostridium] colinum]|uniref:D-alanyl-D-alanine carboxypeptidase family protein n=1 Tax=[Clostridium] colinum TaxID=36835 RepID=UPI002025402B|nr:D-alanyl-D-alanine carboxypeptidase family protein [[Clostridium] colinum]